MFGRELFVGWFGGTLLATSYTTRRVCLPPGSPDSRAADVSRAQTEDSRKPLLLKDLRGFADSRGAPQPSWITNYFSEFRLLPAFRRPTVGLAAHTAIPGRAKWALIL
jgi:hypothetical protein